MVFSSIPFLYYFLPVVLLVYFAAPKRWKNAALLLASLFFYAWGEPRFVVFMVFTIVQGYVFGILIENAEGRRAKLCLAASVVISLGVLIYCKYVDFFIENINAVTGLSIPFLRITLPIGISFYTFQILSYVVDVYRGSVPAQKNFVKLATYVAMFPQLIAGPIVRYADIAAQLDTRTHSLEKCSLGIRRFLLGLGKKVLLANTLSAMCAAIKVSSDLSVLSYWLYAVGCTLYIYFDFSGYSDMAIGLGKLFGFEFSENFRYPYISKSVTEFWRRWHISLGSWFRDYVYIPLGGNRVAKWRWLLNIMLVWLLTGFWHGAAWNFMLWGIYFGILLIAEKLWLMKLLDKTKVLRHLYVLFVVTVSFILFDSAGLSEAAATIGVMFGAGALPAVSGEALYFLKSYALIFVLAMFGATPLPAALAGKIGATKVGGRLLNICEPVYLFLLLVTATGFIVDGSFNPFLYFRF